jgi:cytochrome c
MTRNVVLVAVALAALAACGPSGEKPAAAPPPSASTAPAPSAPAPAPPEPKLITLDAKGPDGAQLVGDAVKGRKVYAQCMSCHSLDAGRNLVGPSMHGIIGRTAGTVEGFNYSPANRDSGIVWTDQEMFTYLENPRAKIPNTIMAFAGIKDVQQRADVIAYIKDNSQ